MAIQPPAVPPQPPSGPSFQAAGISPELREVLDFTERENDRHREFFQMLYTRTAGALTVIVVTIGALGGFIGWHTIDDIRKQATVATDEEIKNIRKQSQETLIQQTAQVQRQIGKRLDDEFATPAIKKTVGEAARQQTSGALLPIINKEVRSEVGAGVKAEQQAIKQSLLQEVHASVEGLKPTINKRVDDTVEQSVNAAVRTQVDTQITPRIQQLEASEQLSVLINEANNDDGVAFDRLVIIAVDNNAPQTTRDLALKVVRAQLQAAKGLHLEYHFNEPKTEAQLVQILGKPIGLDRQGAIVSLGDAYWKSHLDQLFALMNTDASLDARTAAFTKFEEITHIKGSPLDNYGNRIWWTEHRKDFIK